MVSRSCRTERRGFSLVEALVALAAGALLLGLAFGVLRTGSRIQARAESKLAATSESELVLRTLGRDLSAAIEPPRIDGHELVITTTRSPSVTWSFTAVPGGKGSLVERRHGNDVTRHLAGALIAASLAEVATAGRRSIALALTAQGLHDAASAEFRETFFLRGVDSDRDWNPLR